MIGSLHEDPMEECRKMQLKTTLMLDICWQKMMMFGSVWALVGWFSTQIVCVWAQESLKLRFNAANWPNEVSTFDDLADVGLSLAKNAELWFGLGTWRFGEKIECVGLRSHSSQDRM